MLVVKKFLFHILFAVFVLAIALFVAWLAMDVAEIPPEVFALWAIVLYLAHVSMDLKDALYRHLFGKKETEREG